MNDNILASALFALIAAVAVMATAQIVQAEIDLERSSVAAESTKAEAATVAVAQADPVMLPRVVVTGRHVPAPDVLAASSGVDVAPRTVVAS
jgi:hypothetical protein